jgi:hypothetical protein
MRRSEGIKNSFFMIGPNLKKNEATNDGHTKCLITAGHDRLALKFLIVYM